MLQFQEAVKPALLLSRKNKWPFHLNNNKEIQHNLQKATFSTSVGLAMEEEMTPERTPHITLVSSVSSARREEWEADCDCEQAAFDTMQQTVNCIFTITAFERNRRNNELLVQQIDGTCLNRSTGTSAPPLKEECACVNGGGSQSARMCVYKCVCRGERETERDRETGTHPLVSQPAVV